MKAQKQILSNSTPINFYFTEFELVHYSLIDWLSYACQASFRLIGWLNRFKETHCASWLRNWAVSVSLRLMPGIKMQCNAHLNKLHSRGFERNESICKQSDSVPNLASFYRTCRGLQLCFAVFLFYHQWNTGIFFKNE